MQYGDIADMRLPIVFSGGLCFVLRYVFFTLFMRIKIAPFMGGNNGRFLFKRLIWPNKKLAIQSFLIPPVKICF